MAQFFYNFCFPDHEAGLKNSGLKNSGFKNYGFYYLSHQDGRIYSHTEFNTPDGIYRNIFNLKIKESTVIAYKHNDGPWVDVQENHFPTSAYPLLLPKVGNEPLRYLCISEDTGELIGEAVLTRQVNDEAIDIVETVQHKVMRRFTMAIEAKTKEAESHPELPSFLPKSIDWGGAKSFLCRDEAEAVQGTSFKIDSSILQKK